MMKTALVTLSAEGVQVIRQLASGFPQANLFVHQNIRMDIDALRFKSIVELTAVIFNQYKSIIYVAPTGVVVRAIAPHVKSKYTDPAVVVVDAMGRFAISLLSGHEGGANEITIQAANLIGAEPVVTTTTEALKSLIVGVGCRRGAKAEVIIEAIKEALSKIKADPEEVRLLASADIKAREEGLIEAAGLMGIPLRLITSEEIREAKKIFTNSELAQKKVGLPAVAEPAALLAGKHTRLILERITWKSITVAIARENFT
ncbi:MAG: cobalamin biosynthesis protein [Smithella sp.]